MLRPIALACGLLLATALPAQQTWVVNPNGTGNFTDLAAALATAAPGDTIRMAGNGVYNAPTGYQVLRPVHLVADLPPSGINYLRLGAAAAGTTISGLGIQVLVLDSVAAASLEDVQMTGFSATQSNFTANRCTFGGRATVWGWSNTYDLVARVIGGHGAFNQCGFRGTDAQLLVTGPSCQVFGGTSPSLIVSANAVVEVANSSVLGNNSLTAPGLPSMNCPYYTVYCPSTSALSVETGSQVFLTHSSVEGGLWPDHFTRTPAVTGGGAVLADASAQFLPAYAGATPVLLPATGGQGALPAGAMTCRIDGPPNLPAVLVASFGARAPLQLTEGFVWVDLAAMVILRLGATSPGGTMSTSIPLPALVTRGLSLTVQGAVVPAAGSALVAAVPVGLQVL